MAAKIEAEGLSKRFGTHVALVDFNIEVAPGEIFGLIGPNGAGKTTFLRLLTGYWLPTEGDVRVDGDSVVSQRARVQAKLGYLPESAPLYSEMLVQDYLQFMADMRGLDPPTRRRRMGEVIEECDISSVLIRPIGHLSKGFRQRVGLASAILHDPEILILDEPTIGLDPNQIIHVRDLIRRMGEKKKTIIISTHILPEVEATCGRAVILIDGRVRADGSLDDLTRSRVQAVTVAPDDPGAAQALFERLEGVASVERAAAGDGFVTFRLHLSGDGDVGEPVAEIVRQRGWPLRELRRDDKSLEQVFRELTETAEEEAA